MGMVKGQYGLPPLAPRSSQCEFRSSDGKGTSCPILLAPIGVKQFPDRLVIAWACSRGLACWDRTCRYAKGGQEVKDE